MRHDLLHLACGALLLAACGPANEHLVDGVTQVELAPPASLEAGWQLSIAPFSVASGQEVQRCYFFQVPYDQAVFVHKIEVAQTTGSHHMNLFRVRTARNLIGKDGDTVVDGECWKPTNWSDWPLVVNSQREGHVVLELPEGVAHRFDPGEMLMVQTHYVNATTQVTPAEGKVLINLNRMPAEAVTAELGTAFATNQNIKICPGQTNQRFETTCRFAHDTPVTIFGANGHFHSRGRRFTISTFDPQAGAGATPFYESREWDDPPLATNLGVAVPAGGGVSYACEYTVRPDQCGDPANDCCFTFGGHVEYQEHCNAFVYYYPRSASDVNCF
jgi:hypothetical protein